MAKISKVSKAGRFPKVPKGTPKVAKKSSAKADRKGGGGNKAFGGSFNKM